MVDYNELKRKFKAKKPASAAGAGPLHRTSSKAAVKAIAREYEMKKAELTSRGVPLLRKGPVFYGIVLLVLAVLGGLVLTAAKDGIGLGRRRIERKDLMARKAMNALTVALGRYRFHVGAYPTTEEGLAALACRSPEELREIRRRHPPKDGLVGWDGPYVNHIVKDPWGHDYIYETRPGGGTPILFSKGPDGRMGTPDDVMPDLASFDVAFTDTSWTNHWAPAELRGIVIAPDEETKRRVNAEMRKYGTSGEKR